jgi:hypothetical protein
MHRFAKGARKRPETGKKFRTCGRKNSMVLIPATSRLDRAWALPHRQRERTTRALEMNLQPARQIGIDLAEKSQEFLMPVSSITVADRDTTGHIHRRKQ